jgi:translation initiation factor IF-1
MQIQEGTVVEALPHALFAIELDSGKRVIGHVSGQDRVKMLRIIPGDRVTIELSPYDLTRGRITRRHR